MVELFREFGDSRKGKRKTALLCGKLGKKGENQRNKECGFSFCRSSRVLLFLTISSKEFEKKSGCSKTNRCGEKALISLQTRSFGRRNNLSLYISF